LQEAVDQGQVVEAAVRRLVIRLHLMDDTPTVHR
jgi:hypothetical protein